MTMTTTTTTNIVPSPMQQAIIDWVATGTGSAVVQARAGSGKTKTIELCLPQIPAGLTVQLVAFNVTIAKELNARIEKLRLAGRLYCDAQASTFHSLCFRAVAKKLDMADIRTDGGKLRKLCDSMLGADDQQKYASFIAKLVGLAKGQGIGALVPDTEDAWYEIIQRHDLTLDHEEATEGRAVELARALLRQSNDEALRGNIDFDDQLYLAVLWKLRLWQNDWLIVDEAQDTNPIRRAIMKMALRPGGRMMAVGDDRQAIYGFTGASADALDIIVRQFSAQVFPLSVCYRCAQAIVAQAQIFVPDLEWAPGAVQGRVSSLPVFGYKHSTTGVWVEGAMDHLTATSAILCRSVAPLVSLAFTLIAGDMPCTVLGRDIARGLVELVEKRRAKGIEHLEEKLEAFLQSETAKFMAKGEEGKAESLSDRVACVRTIMARLDDKERTIPGLLRRIDGMFSDQTANILTLSSIHKAKGREWNTVAVLAPWLSPSKYARQDWQKVQEENLMYVRDTRAMEHLIYLTDEGAA